MIRLFLLIILLFTSCLQLVAGNEQVSFKSGDVTLSGTLMTPRGSGPFPAVIFLHGSGPEDRSNSKTRASQFVKQGYVALIYDKRGVGKSEGDPDFNKNYSFEILADDAIAAADFLRSRAEVNAEKIGFVAASQSGWVAPLAATKTKHIAFMIIISGSVSTVGEDNIFERNARLKNEGFNDAEIDEVTHMHKLDIEVTRSGDTAEQFQELWNKHKNSRWFKRVYLSEYPLPADHSYRRWYKTVVDFNTLDYLNSLDIPILWLYGDASLDRFCPVNLSLERLEKLKAEGKDYEIRIVNGADHSLNIKSKDAAISDFVFEWLKTHSYNNNQLKK
jgi:dienelactone hydrolase